MNDDAISRQEVLDQTYLWSKDEFLRVTNPFDYLRKRINSLSPVTPKLNDKKCEDCAYYGVFSSDCARCDDNYNNWMPKQRTGRWKHGICCDCGFDWGKIAPIANVPLYCPSCGAKMVDPQESEE